MDVRELLRELQGSRSSYEMAELMGVSPSTVRMILTGQRGMGREVMARLIAAFPERRDEILAVFLDQGGHNCEEPVTQEATP